MVASMMILDLETVFKCVMESAGITLFKNFAKRLSSRRISWV